MLEATQVSWAGVGNSSDGQCHDGIADQMSCQRRPRPQARAAPALQARLLRRPPPHRQASLCCDGPQVKDKVDSLTATLRNAKNEKWCGAMAKIGGSALDLTKLHGDVHATAALDVGQHPWVTSVKEYAWRWGANAWPLPGVGSWVYALTPIILLVFDAKQFVSNGLVNFRDVPAFMETDSGRKLSRESMTIIDMRVCKLAWIPFGFLVAPLGLPFDDEVGASEASGSSKASAPPKLSFALCVPGFSAKLVCDVPEGVWAPIAALNRSHFERMGHSPLWSARATAFEALGNMRTS